MSFSPRSKSLYLSFQVKKSLFFFFKLTHSWKILPKFVLESLQHFSKLYLP